MVFGWLQAPILQKYSKDYRDQVTGRWRVNIFFFLLVSIHSLLLPWLPVVLQSSGLTYFGMGTVMALSILCSLVSIKIGLVFITATRSGAVRRFTLFILLMSSLIMYVFAIVVLPSTKIIDEQCSINRHSVFTNPYDITTVSNAETTATLSFISEHSKAPHQSKPSTASKPKVPTTTPKLQSDKTTSVTPLASKTESVFVESKSTIFTTTNSPKKNILSTTIDPEISVVERSRHAPEQVFPENDIASPNVSDVHNFVDEKSSETSEIHRQQDSPLLVNRAQYHDAIQRQNHIYSSREPSFNYDDTVNRRLPFVNKNPMSVIHTQLYSAIMGDERNFNDKDFESSRRNRLSAWEDEQQIGGILYDRYEEKYQSNYRNKKDSSLQRRKSKSYTRNSDSVQESKEASYIDFPQNYEEKKHKHVERRTKIFKNKINELRSVRSIGDDNKELDNLKDVKRSKYEFRKVNLEMTAEETTNDTENATEPDDDDTEDITETFTWLWVSMLLVSASILGSGLEASVTRLWHCYSHGYHLFHDRPRQDTNSDDLLERTLTDTFELSAIGEHYGWTRLLAGCVVLAAGVLLALGCQIGLSPGWSLEGQAALFTIGGFFTIAALLIVLPMPWGSIKPPKMSRPLSLYLDDEVLWEGLRRVASPSGAALHGLLSALPTLYVVPVLSTLATQNNLHSGLVSVLGVSCSLVGEGGTMCCRRCLTTIFDSPGLVGMSLASLSLQLFLAWLIPGSGGVWFVAVTWLLVGASQALVAISMRQNALMLATIRDQEREAWISWCSARAGMAVGAVVWPVVATTRWGPDSLPQLMLPVSITAAVLTVTVVTVALLTRSRRAARRRVYHTLDLQSGLHDGDEDSEDEEEDWLVRGARNEGLVL